MPDTGLYAEILAELKQISAEVSMLKVTNAQAIAESRQRQKQAEDHEARLRVLEHADYVTRQELDAGRRANNVRLATWIAVALTVTGIFETGFIALFFP